MFEGLDERIKQDEPSTRVDRLIRLAIVLAVSVAVFGGLYYGLQVLD